VNRAGRPEPDWPSVGPRIHHRDERLGNLQNQAMKTKLITAASFYALAFATTVAQAADALPSWNDGKTKQSIMDFVTKVTKQGSPDFVPPAERIATFDNDSTLWAEQPLYFQILFAIDRIKQLAPQHPEWKEKDPFKSVLAGDMKARSREARTR
jgi:hypothetical protein